MQPFTPPPALLLVGGALLTSVALASSAALGQEKSEPKTEGAAAALRMRLAVEEGDTLRYRRTRERKATCEALGRKGDDALVQDVTMTVKSVADDGGIVLALDFAPATGHFTQRDGTRLEPETAKRLPDEK